MGSFVIISKDGPLVDLLFFGKNFRVGIRFVRDEKGHFGKPNEVGSSVLFWKDGP